MKSIIRRASVIFIAALAASCEYNLGPTVNVENTNTNTNTNTIDIHDLVNFVPVANPSAPVPAPGGGMDTPLPLPLGAQAIAQGIANSSQIAIMRSCQDTFGDAAWVFMDTVVKALAATDVRWGYLIRPDGRASRDVIAYRATSDNIGAWGIDIIVGHCGTTPSFSWQVLGFDPNTNWSASR